MIKTMFGLVLSWLQEDIIRDKITIIITIRM